MRRLLAVLAVLALASVAVGEVQFKVLSVTDTSQYFGLTRASADVTLCNTGANPAYYRLFDEMDTPAAATTSYALLAASTCIPHSKGPTTPFYYRTISIIAGTGLTTTVNVYYQ